MMGILLGVALVWLLILSAAMIGLVRYVGVLQAAGTTVAGQQSHGNAMLDTDGPYIPSPLPDRTAATLLSYGAQPADLVATFFSPTCGSCLERAEQIAGSLVDAQRNVFLMTGDDPDRATDMLRILEPTGVTVIRSPDAQNILKSLDISSTPFTFRVLDGQVVAKAYVRGLNDYLRMFDATPPGPAAAPPGVQEIPLIPR
jgi:hypothetical protein